MIRNSPDMSRPAGAYEARWYHMKQQSCLASSPGSFPLFASLGTRLKTVRLQTSSSGSTLASFPGHSQILCHNRFFSPQLVLQGKIWEGLGDEASSTQHSEEQQTCMCHYDIALTSICFVIHFTRFFCYALVYQSFNANFNMHSASQSSVSTLQ